MSILDSDFATTRWVSDEYITNWEEFDEKVRSKGHPLLKRLDEFPDSVLVTGCQRSGTTMLSRVITQSDGMVNYWFGPDDELDAALILSGYVAHPPAGRYCFQTTYINRRYHEYYVHTNGHKILFVLRNPFSVVHSVLYNWRDTALERFFRFNGISHLTGVDKWLYKSFGARSISKLRQACWGYKGKVLQLFELKQHLNAEQLMVVDYDDLVMHKAEILPIIYSFCDLDYKIEYADRIHSKSISKVTRLSTQESKVIKSLCEPIYQNASQFRTSLG